MKKLLIQRFLRTLFLIMVFFLGMTTASAQTDSLFYSPAFETERDYRIYLPVDYDTNSEKEYPVVYYFHGWGGRYKWDNYVVEDDPDHENNGRINPPFVMEWLDYSQNHDVIIVTWDGYEPNLHPGNSTREGIRYGGCQPYDYPRAHESGSQIRHWGWDFKMHFRELVAHIDSSYRTINDRDHRAITGLSMGGLTSLYIAGQNKDLVGSLSAFCPADVIPQYGPKGYLSVFPVLEMYRSLKGMHMRLTATDGDWLHAHDIQMKRIFEGSGFESFEFHEADFPDHWAADIDLQLDYHMAEFDKVHPRPGSWNHICPSYKTFDQWGYSFNIERSAPALTILEQVSKKHMKVYSREFIPDGPLVSDETIGVSTDSLYTPSSSYNFNVYNLTKKSFTTHQVPSTPDGRLNFNLPGGGNILGIHGEGMDNGPDLIVVNKSNRDYLYFEANTPYALDFTMVNVGFQDASNISVKAFSEHPNIAFDDDEISLSSLPSATSMQLDSIFRFSFQGYNDDHLAGNIMLEISIDGVVADTQKVVFFATPESPYVTDDEVIILDGRTQSSVPVFDQGRNSVQKKKLTGGTGNGNGIPEKGEEILVYIKLEQGLSPNDKNTFHKTHLIGAYDESSVTVEKLKYDEKMSQAGATSISTLISIADSVTSDTIDLWFRVESLYNENKAEARRSTYEFYYDYRKVHLAVSGASPKYTIESSVTGSGSISLSPPGGSYDYGEEVILEAIPDSGWYFSGWWGDFLGQTNPYTLTMDGSKSVSASFTEIISGIDIYTDKYQTAIFPNPFNQSVEISYNILEKGDVSIAIYNMKGQKIKELKNATEKPGPYSIEWDGKDSYYKPCLSGVYFCRLSVSDRAVYKKILKL